ncbi:MAG: ankyrin repeat domain-containing protein [Verrucomicrobiota bacterium]|nr:ankyrin repeat domain-containing protein [Verrucomicrobiota bacterium]
MNFVQLRTVLLLFLLVASIGCDFQSKIEVNDNVVWQYLEKEEEYQLAKYLEERPSLVSAVNQAGNSLLYEAIASSNIKIVELILANGAKINFRNQFGRTPLHRAADEDRLDMVRLLLAQGAEVNVRDCRGSTPLIASAEFASLPVLKLLVEAGANVPAGNHYGRSALHNAAKREDVSVTEFLIAHGARLNQVCEYGTPLDLTANCEIAKVLRMAGGSESSKTSIASRTHQRYLTNLPAGK